MFKKCAHGVIGLSFHRLQFGNDRQMVTAIGVFGVTVISILCVAVINVSDVVQEGSGTAWSVLRVSLYSVADGSPENAASRSKTNREVM